MRKTKYTVKPTTQFKKDYKLAMKRGLKINLLEDVIAALAMGEPLPEKSKDHALTGNWAGHRECYVLPDWLLVYRIEDDVLVLTLAPPEHTAICLENEKHRPPHGRNSVRRFCYAHSSCASFFLLCFGCSFASFSAAFFKVSTAFSCSRMARISL